MANIPVEQSNRSTGMPWWAWLIGLLVLIALVWVITSALSGTPVDERGAPAGDQETATPPAQPTDQDEPGGIQPLPWSDHVLA